MRSTAPDHMKFASSAPTAAQTAALDDLIKEALQDLEIHEVILPCGSVIRARQSEEYSPDKLRCVPTGRVAWSITDGKSGAVKTGTHHA